MKRPQTEEGMMRNNGHNWARAWKAAAKRYRMHHMQLVDDYRSQYAEMCSLAHAERVQVLLKGFALRVHRKKWRTESVWRAWYVWQTRIERLERLRRLQAPGVLVENEVKMVEKARRWFHKALFLEQVGAHQ